MSEVSILFDSFMQRSEHEPSSDRTETRAENIALLLLHGMFGKPKHWRGCVETLPQHWKVFVPELPMFSMPAKHGSVHGLTEYVARLLDEEGIHRVVAAGNSLGGHIALSLALRHPERVAGLILAGSSGLFERSLDGKVPRRPTTEWVQEKVREVFYDEKHVTDELVDEVHGLFDDPRRSLRAVRLAKSAKQENLRTALHRIQCPVLLVWGAADNITPPKVAHEFKQHIPHADLRFIKHCGHAPTLEQPREFSQLVEQFLTKHFEMTHDSMRMAEHRNR